MQLFEFIAFRMHKSLNFILLHQIAFTHSIAESKFYCEYTFYATSGMKNVIIFSKMSLNVKNILLTRPRFKLFSQF